MTFKRKQAEQIITVLSKTSQSQKNNIACFSHVGNLDLKRRHETGRGSIWGKEAERLEGSWEVGSEAQMWPAYLTSVFEDVIMKLTVVYN